MAQSRLPYDFLIRCLSSKGQNAIETLRLEVRDPQCDWEGIIRTASAQKVLPALLGRLEELGIASELPADVADFLFGVREMSRERNEQILAETATVAKLLNGIGVEPVVLKGLAYLLSGVYQDHSSRFIADIDMLLPAPMLMKAVQVLTRNGYAPVDPSFGHHYFPLRRGLGAWVELHHTLGGGTSRSILPTAEVVKESACHQLGDARVKVPCPEHLVIHHIIHAQIHHSPSEGIWPLLRTGYDLLSLQKRFQGSIDWLSIENRFRSSRREGVLAVFLLLTDATWGTRAPIAIRMTALTKLRWYHVKVLRRFPDFRWIDPFYVFLRIIVPRARRIGNLMRIGSGRSYLLASPFRLSFYVHRFDELARAYNGILSWIRRIVVDNH